MKTVTILGPSHKKEGLYYGEREDGRIIDLRKIGSERCTLQLHNGKFEWFPIGFTSVMVKR